MSGVQVGGRRHRRIWRTVIALCGVAVLACGVWVADALAGGGLEPQDTAGVVGLAVSATGVVFAVLALRRRPWDLPDPALIAADLAAHVMRLEAFQRRQLLGADHIAIDTAFTLRSQARSATVRGTSGPLDAGTLAGIAEFYRATGHGRLVITGAAGAGKTVLAVELLLALLEERGLEGPVPVRFVLAGWDTRQAFDAWLVQRLIEDYDRHPEVARALVRQGRVLPVLDGLDEMDAAVSTDGAPRARAAVAALNAYLDGRAPAPMIVTCRTERYAALAGAGRGLRDAAWVELEPVTADQARGYLTERAMDDRWRAVLDELARHPRGRLAAALSSPWQLTLAATVYADQGDPAELLALAGADGVPAHLIERFVPAAVRLHPTEPDRYTSREVHCWLARLAEHLLSPPGERLPGSGAADPHPPSAPDRDIVPHRLWSLAGPRRVRIVHLVVCSGLIVLADFGFSLLALLTRPAPPLLFLAATAMVVLASGVWQWVQPWPQPKRILPYGRLRTAASFGQGGFALLLAMVAAALSITADISPNLVGRGGLIAFGVIAGTVLTFSRIFLGRATSKPVGPADHPATDPRDLLRGDLLSGLLAALVFGAVVGTSAAVTMGGWFGFALGLASLLTVVLVANAWTRFVIFLLCSRRQLPWRLGVFLNWAYMGGLLRISGNAYQFRHLELQNWLAHHPAP
jgi:hypothetical protein